MCSFQCGALPVRRHENTKEEEVLLRALGSAMGCLRKLLCI